MGRYWDKEGPHQGDYDRLHEALVPMQGPADNLEGEFLRAAGNLAYEFYNNGGGNNVSGALCFLKQHYPDFKDSWWDALAPHVTGNGDGMTDGLLPVCEEIVDSVVRYVVGKNGEYTPSELDMLSFTVLETGRETPVSEDDEDFDIEEDDDEGFGYRGR